jgi:hypothetical protein
MLRKLFSWGWSPFLITVLAVVGAIFEWPVEVLGPVLVVILVIGLVMAATAAREKRLERLALRLNELGGHFNRRFMGDSSLSIFVVIRTLLTSDNARVWAWARECEVAQRVFNTWASSFATRLESDIRGRRFSAYLRTSLNELWLLNTHYYEFIEQFSEVAEKIELPPETVDLYNRFAVEYNAFIQDFRDSIAELREFARTEIEPPSVNFAKELRAVGPVRAKEVEPERKPPTPPRHEGGYITG